ncbi:hypothetical protein GBF38_007133, partial [Nibea albiflora]
PYKRSRHFKVVNLVPGVDVLHSHRHERVITGTAGGLCTPTGQPCYPAALVHTHLHQINACPLILAGPFITFLTASVQPQKRSPGKEVERRRITPLHLRFVLGENIHPDPRRRRTVYPEKAVEERETYLSTHRCSRIEVVGYPQNPQHGKTQHYPRFPPHGCLVFSSVCFVGLLWLRLVPVGCVRAGRFAVRLRQASSVGQGERREQEAASQHQRG